MQRYLIYILPLFLLPALLHLSCSGSEEESVILERFSIKGNWYRQTGVDLGNRIIMDSENEGLAISMGRGEIEGHAYRYINNEWVPFYDYPYSDYPLIAKYPGGKVWTVNHLTHKGAYKPVFSEFSDTIKTEKNLPKIMWDETDYVMWKGISVLDDGTAWMAGQQGNIIHYDGSEWIKRSNLDLKEEGNLFAGDLNDIFMLNGSSGWAAGKDGIILRYKDGIWHNFKSPVTVTLERIYMISESKGWITGREGTILRYNGVEWVREEVETAEDLFTIKALDEYNVWAAGSGSALLYFDGNKWRQEITIKNYSDKFNDLAVLRGEDGDVKLWLIGMDGIYTNAMSSGVSFTDHTAASSLRRSGTAGIFMQGSNEEVPNLFVTDEGSSYFYKNGGGGRFSEAGHEAGIKYTATGSGAAVSGDVNNDGYEDILLVSSSRNFSLYLGRPGGRYLNFTRKSNLDFTGLDSYTNIAYKFVDFNNDGNLDLYVSNGFNDDLIFRNNGAGIFENIYDKTGLYKDKGARSSGANFADYNSDGLTDIFIPYQVPINNRTGVMFLNRGDFGFSRQESDIFISGIDLYTASSISEDFDNDGNMDIFLYNRKAPPQLFLNTGNAHFKDVSEEAGFTKTIIHLEPLNGIIGAADVNNDGYKDIYVSTLLLLNQKGYYFKEAAGNAGISFKGNPSFADIDDDGDQDLFIGSSRGSLGEGDRAALYRNNINDSNYIKIRLEAGKSTSGGTGTKVYFTAYNKAGQRIYTHLEEAGLGAAPMLQKGHSEVHNGIDTSYRYDVKIVFPSGIEKSINNARGKYSVSELGFAEGLFYSIIKSAGRTYLLLDKKEEIFKLLAAVLIFIILIYGGEKWGAGGAVRKWYTGLLFLTAYILLLYLTVYESVWLRYLIQLGGLAGGGTAAVYFAGRVIKQREALYISRYKLIKPIGYGGMGKVYEAAELTTKKSAAIKILNEELLSDEANKERFANEGKLLSRFDHPNIVKVFETGESGGRGYIVMELLRGGTLREYIKKNYPLKPNEIIELGMQICSGLTEIHSKGIIHRDLKTNNIMFDSEGRIRIMDFGLSKSSLISTLTSLGTVIGTLGYAAPEQITNNGVSSKTDIFSFGVIMYELCTNSAPFRGENEIALIHSIFNTVPRPPSELNSLITPELDELVRRCLEKRPEDRFENAEEIIQSLEAVSI